MGKMTAIPPAEMFANKFSPIDLASSPPVDRVSLSKIMKRTA